MLDFLCTQKHAYTYVANFNPHLPAFVLGRSVGHAAAADVCRSIDGGRADRQHLSRASIKDTCMVWYGLTQGRNIHRVLFFLEQQLQHSNAIDVGIIQYDYMYYEY